MPCKSFICEFCDTTFRADAIAVHIKAKHMAELKQFILNDFKEYNHNYIQSYCNNSSVYSMDSKRHDGCSYVFGVKPAFFEDNPKSNSEMSQYLSSSENKLKHREFIGDIIKSITLMEFIDFQKDLFVRSPEKDKMAKEIKDITIKAKQISTDKKITLSGSFIVSLDKFKVEKPSMLGISVDDNLVMDFKTVFDI